jgi:predicted transcriptional regulator
MSKVTKVQVHVGSLADMGARFVGAWRLAEQGKAVNETHVTFLDLDSMLAALSPRRLELLRHVHAHGAQSVRELAVALGRDYKNVHQDVTALSAAGLLLREGRRLAAPWDELQASVALG